MSKKKKTVTSTNSVFILYIKRTNTGPLETIAVASTKAKAKNMVRSIYNQYITMCEKLGKPDTSQEAYNVNFWKDHPEDNRFCYYVLNANATAYFLILEFALDDMAISYRVPSKETLENYTLNNLDNSSNNSKAIS